MRLGLNLIAYRSGLIVSPEGLGRTVPASSSGPLGRGIKLLLMGPLDSLRLGGGGQGQG